MKRACYGLIGYPLGHSFSAAYFTQRFESEGINAIYTNFPIPTITSLPTLLATETSLQGFNVTIPYKEQILPLLHHISPEAQAIGAVNCVRIERTMTDALVLHGYNTDIIGFTASLSPYLHLPTHANALVLGTGGAAKAVCYALGQLGITVQLVSRTAQSGILSYAEVTPAVLATHRLIVNTTPCGMFPHIATFPDLPYTALGTEHLLFDLVYNPLVTRFMSLGAAQGATVVNGLRMLHLQADAAWDIWNAKY